MTNAKTSLNLSKFFVDKYIYCKKVLRFKKKTKQNAA